MRFDFDDRFQRQAGVDDVLLQLLDDGDAGRRRRVAQVEQGIDDAMADQRGEREIVGQIVVEAAARIGLIASSRIDAGGDGFDALLDFMTAGLPLLVGQSA